jgi:amino acid permease
MAKAPHARETVLELVQWIDNNESKLIKFYDELGGMGQLLGFLFVALFIIAEAVNFTTSDFAVKMSIQLAILAVFFALISVVFQISEKRKLEIRFKRARKLRNLEDKEIPILKALIRIKSDNEETKLMTIYEMNREAHGSIFSEKNLLESICK